MMKSRRFMELPDSRIHFKHFVILKNELNSMYSNWYFYRNCELHIEKYCHGDCEVILQKRNVITISTQIDQFLFHKNHNHLDGVKSGE